MIEKFRTALVLAPHTDDGEFGCGGTMARLIESGVEVTYVAFSTAAKSVPEGFPRDILRTAPGCLVIDKREPGGSITPHEAAGEDATYISRIREDATVENGLSLWCVADNLRKGAALNAVQIAEVLINRKLIVPKQKAA